MFEDERIVVKVNPKWWTGVPGGMLEIPRAHYENLYDLPNDVALAVHRSVHRTSLTLKALGCDGITVRQHNEPAGGQDVWHFHVHVFPRHTGDDLNAATSYWADRDDIGRYAARVRAAWREDPSD